MARVDATYDISERQVAEMRNLVLEMNSQAMRALSEYERAAVLYRQTAAAQHSASGAYVSAAHHYREAERKFRRVAYMMIAAASSDLFLRGVCGASVSTRRYRAYLRSNGLELDGIDIDHVWPRSRGGPDRPWNYMPLESSINRSLGANGLLWKLQNYPLHTINAMAKTASHALLC